MEPYSGLWSLCKETYEPLHLASVKDLTLKTVFLLALASSKRCSELHALSVDPPCLRHNEQDDSFSLLLDPCFMAKNQLPSVIPEPIFIPSLSITCDRDDRDRYLCPVRALKFYLKRVKATRGTIKRLFPSFKGTKGGGGGGGRFWGIQGNHI